MFRKMRRFKQQISNEECVEILKNEKRGVLSVIGDNGYPYGIPLNHYYDEKTNSIFFHGAKEGHKIDAIKKNEINHSANRVLCLKITIDHMTGKKVNES